jgi:hypothetical protein
MLLTFFAASSYRHAKSAANMQELANLPAAGSRKHVRRTGHILPLVFPYLALPLDGFLPIAYKSYDSVLYGNPVEIRSGPATVSVEDRSK